MKKQILALCSLFLLLGAPAILPASAQGISGFISGEQQNGTSEGRGVFRILLNAISGWQDLREELTRQRANLEFERNFNFPNLQKWEQNQTQIETLQQEIENLRTQLNDLSPQDPQVDALVQSLEEKQQRVQVLQTESERLYAAYQTRLTEQEENIETYRENIDTLEEEIQRQKNLVQTYFERVGWNVLFFLGILVGLFLMRFVFAKIILKLNSDKTKRRREILLNLNRMVFNVIIAIAILTILFSQFVNLIPFLLLLGTGLSFALRDSISSFLGWLVIGTDKGYKVGDIIKIGDITYGKVKEISPMVTYLTDLTRGEKSGKVITVPNKFIFEQKILNYSRCQRCIRDTVAFYLLPETDLDAAKKLFFRVLKKVVKPDSEEHQKVATRLQRYCQFTEAETQLRVFFEPDENAVLMKGRFIVSMDEIEEVRDQIIETYLKEAQKDPDIILRYWGAGTEPIKGNSSCFRTRTGRSTGLRSL
ncbi:MAG: mechanosensitive ion channel [Candidatus Gracilibacteria bacterium]|nr:mechanosensitive ion channel [Candidatus Gracilibacteria bacterium]